MTTTERRYDIDWIRVIAIGLLLIYHVAIGFQPWGIMIGFIANEKTWPSLWTAMSMLNIWRIPLLFFVSGMGVFFAIRNRSWKQLLLERSTRILIPFLVGIFLIFPASVYIWQRYYHFDVTYNPHPGHLWFLGNIFSYVMILSPVLFYLKRNAGGKLALFIRKIFSHPLGLLVVITAFIIEGVAINPAPYEMYVMNWHGFVLGLLAFFFGFCFVFSGGGFWKMMLKWRWIFFVAAVGLFGYRLMQFQMRVPIYQLVVESNAWIFSVFAFGQRYLNRPGPTLRYLSEAAYPVYIMHMIFLFTASMFVFPLNIDVHVQYMLVLGFTLVGSLGFYELIIRRANFIRPLFGLKAKEDMLMISDRESARLLH